MLLAVSSVFCVTDSDKFDNDLNRIYYTYLLYKAAKCPWWRCEMTTFCSWFIWQEPVTRSVCLRGNLVVYYCLAALKGYCQEQGVLRCEDGPLSVSAAAEVEVVGTVTLCGVQAFLPSVSLCHTHITQTLWENQIHTAQTTSRLTWRHNLPILSLFADLLVRFRISTSL